ncbi:hypothetical protein A3I48_02955, partial [Candidatus Daviesbacteria bacterium RIFCSPLOWO2_02_FULL_36_7]
MNLKTPLEQITGIGPFLLYKLKMLNLETVEDLIYHFPFRYDDFSAIKSTSQAQIGEIVTLQGEIWSIKNIFTRYGKVLTQAIFNDGESPVALTWFNQSWLTKQIKTGDKLQISGKLSKYKNKLSIIAPKWERIQLPTSEVGIHTGRLVPIYPETEGLTSKWFRTKIDLLLPQVLDQLNDPLPESVKNNMSSLPEAIKKVHFPDNFEDAQEGRRRLGFDELFYISLATQKARLSWKQKPAIPALKMYPKDLDKFIKKLPFALTSAQKRVVEEVSADLKKDQAMNRMIQGEVGSGKTVVAAIIIYLIHLNKLKTLFMAPTEILAFQHFSTITNLLEPFGIKVGIYTGSKKFTKNNDLRFKIYESENHKSSIINHKSVPDVIIGTHALLSPKLNIDDVGLVIVDEQQRFGVQQRSFLRSRAKLPHFLTTTATPIPRTVALVFYGDLDLSVIDELPKNRQKIKTFVVGSKKRNDAYKFIEKKVRKGDQVYIIAPLIEESETLKSVKAAKVEFEKLKTKIFPSLRLGLLHGRLKSKEKNQVMQDFKDFKIDILISTSVVEVGMDITNATIMVIESAERFGLAQLHQLRGRVGRGPKESYCLLFTEIEEPSTINRLKNMERIDNGMKLAELDLKIRGSGEIFGTRQS